MAEGFAVSGWPVSPWYNNGTNHLLRVDQAIAPQTTDGAALGTSGLNWSDLFLDSGAVINFDGGDVTLTHSANTLTFGGGDLFIGNGFGVVIGHTAQVTVSVAGEFQVLGNGDAASSAIIGRFANNSASPDLTFVKSKSDTVGTAAILADNDEVGKLEWYAADNTDLNTHVGRMLVEVDDASPAASQIGTAMVFYTADGVTNNNLTERLRIAANGSVYINDDTVNANMTTGLTINQGATYDEALALKSSGLTHGVTNQAETDTYAYFAKRSDDLGGLLIKGFDGGSSPIVIEGISTTETTTKVTGSVGNINLVGLLKAGSGAGDIGTTDSNILVIRNNATTRFIFDIEGSAHADIEWIAFSEHDDIALMTDMEAELQLRETESQTGRRHALEAVGIIGENSWHSENGKPRAMVNVTKLSMLHHGALIQSAERIEALETKLLALEGAK
jgi:hypothetical protein